MLPHRLQPLRDEQGIALVMALMTMVVLTLVTTSVVMYTTNAQHSSELSQTRDGAYRLAESGVNNALALLGNPTNNALDPNSFCGLPGITYVSGCQIKTTYANGYVVWSGTLTPATASWKITATGYVVNTDVPTAPTYSSRTISVNVSVTPTLTQPLNTPIWNYIYATKPASTPPTCDEDLNNSVTIASPFYVAGNLCLHQTSTITKGPLVVLGRMMLDSKTQNYAGTSATPLGEAHILNGCAVKGVLSNPCHKPADGTDNVWATTIDTTAPTGLTPPTPDWNTWYLNASPGPYFPCQTMNGQAPLNPPTFDNAVDPNVSDPDATRLTYMNNSAGIQNLTPAYDYRCQTLGGELSWSNMTKTLTIKGTIFIDGSAYISNGAANLYSGQGVIYLRGTLLMKNGSLCGAVYNGSCDLRTYQSSPAQGWNPNTNLLCFVTYSAGGQVNSWDSAQLTSATLQGALFATNDIELDTSSNVDGPLVGYQVILGQSVTTSFPSITIVPNGMPANPVAYAQVNPPTGWSE